jgi:hypothetical protein
MSGCLDKQQLNLVFPFASLSLKRNLNAIAIEYIYDIILLFTENENGILLNWFP